MRLINLSVSNYKSLRDISLSPADHLTVVIGANASGKSNLADFHDFLADLYKHGLAVAVARKGGYENIAHRKMRRSRGAISVALVAEIDSRAMRSWPGVYRRALPAVRFYHSFSFKAETQAIRSDFRIEYEEIMLEERTTDGWRSVARVRRDRQRLQHEQFIAPERGPSAKMRDRLFGQFRFLNNLDDMVQSESMPTTELLLSSIGRFIPILRLISEGLAAIKVLQLSPTNTREFGVPIPNPEMHRHGGNLPAVVDMIARHHPRIWNQVINVMRQLLPTLERIEVDYTHSRTLGLFFYEQGVGRPWTVSEVSDGTIHSLALLVALYDPRTTMLVLEEPENSIHTWILRTLMEAAREAAQSKQILLTTHSRTVVDSVRPKQVWVMWRAEGESRLSQLSALSTEISKVIAEGELTTFELLDTGLVTEAIPPFPKEH